MRFRWLTFITWLLIVQTTMAAAPQIWIALRTDGKRGRGTQKDPYNGTAQMFDQVMRAHTLRGTKNLTVNILPGTYLTVGNGDYVPGLTEGTEGWRCHSGWTIKGAGQSATTLKLVKIYPSPDGKTYGAGGICTASSKTANVTVQDLTVDCNHSKIGNNKTSETGVALGGSNHTIQRVTVKNVAGLAGEVFPIFIVAISVNSSNNLIQNCTITDWKGGAGGSITMSNNVNNMVPPYTYISGTVRNNRVVGTTIGYGGWGMNGVVFSGNVAEGCGYGVNIDSVTNQNVTFVNNQFLKCQGYGMVMANCHGFLIKNNTINMAGNTGFGILFSRNDSNMTVIGNTFTAQGPQSTFAAAGDAKTLSGKFIFSGNSPASATIGGFTPSLLVKK